MDYATVLSIYEASDGEATKALYENLSAFGPAGEVAKNLFRAQKASARAKVYRGGERGRGSFRSMAYDRKGWALDNLCAVLVEHGPALKLGWGWGEDSAQAVHRHVLYVDLPNGQVSFHAGLRGVGPDYRRRWDGQRGAVPARVCRFCADVLAKGGA
jgi:hypothetical protein